MHVMVSKYLDVRTHGGNIARQTSSNPGDRSSRKQLKMKLVHLGGVSLFVLLIGAGISTACADERIDLIPAVDWPAQWRATIEDYFFKDVNGRKDLAGVQHYRKVTHQDSLSDQELIDTLGAAFDDLDDDGSDELVILFSPEFGACGSGGCAVEIYRKVDSRWQNIGGFRDDGEDFTVLDHTDGGFHAIAGSAGSLGNIYARWNGKEYTLADRPKD